MSSPPTQAIKFYDHIIRTTVTSSASVADKWITDLLRRVENQLVVGLDTEWCLDEHQTVAILQLCVGHVFQIINADDIPLSLVRFLLYDNLVFAGVNVKTDARKLKEDYGLTVSSTMDVRYKFAKKYLDKYYKRSGLNSLSGEFLEMIMLKPKHITMSKWDVEELSYAQVEYAAIDAFVSLQLALEANRPLAHPLKYIFSRRHILELVISIYNVGEVEE